MANLFQHFDTGVKYDLKGSTKSRTRLMNGENLGDPGVNKTISLKCNDFRKFEGTVSLVEQMNPT